MKKMIYLMTAVITALAFNACSVNDNPSTPGNLSGRAVITVNTAAMYEEADMVGIMELYLSKFIHITDTVLIYNQNGNLVKKVGTETKSLEPVTIVADDLPNGTYTFVIWQTAYSSDGAMKIPYALADEEELATVKLVPIRNILIYANANGFANTTVTVNGNSFEATVTPKLIGRFVDIKSEKPCDEYSFDELVIYRKDQACRGIWLDPSRSGDDRWIVETEKFKSYPLLGYLADDETEFLYYIIEQGNDMELFVGTWTRVGDDWESYDIVPSGHHKLKDGRRFAYYIDVDRVSYQPPFFGLEDQLPAWKADRDAGILVNDPYLKWGGNLAEVEAQKQAKQYWSGGSDQIVFWDGFGWYWYNIANDFTEYYIFETADGQNLISVYCKYDRNDLSADVFNKSLQLQGYTYLGKLHYPDTEDYYDVFLSADEKTEVASYGYLEDFALQLQYFPFDPEDLNYIVPESLAPASSKVPRLVPDVRHSSFHSALKRDDFIKPGRMTTPVGR